MQINWFNLKKIVLSTVRGDQFLYIDSQVRLQVQFLIVTVFPSQFLDPSLSLPSSYFILSLPFHICLPRVDQSVGVDPCHISTFLKSLESSCKVERKPLFRYYFLTNTARELATEHLMWWQQLSLEIFHGFPLSYSFIIFILIHGMIQNITLKGRPHPLTSALLNRGGIPPRTTLLDGFDRMSLLHLLTRILMKVFTCPRIA